MEELKHYAQTLIKIKKEIEWDIKIFTEDKEALIVSLGIAAKVEHRVEEMFIRNELDRVLSFIDILEWIKKIILEIGKQNNSDSKQKSSIVNITEHHET